MTATLLRWKTFWHSTKGPTRQPNPWYVWTKSPSCFMQIYARLGRRGRATSPNGDNEYKRGGTANIFAVVEPKAGRHFTCTTPDRSAFQFAQVVRPLVRAYPFARTIHLIMDNLNIHCRKFLIDHLGQREGSYLWNRLQVHYTPKHGSWLNQAEIELSLVSRQSLGTRRIPNVALIQAETRAWTRRANRQKTKIRWNFTRKAARAKFGYVQNLSRRSTT